MNPKYKKKVKIVATLGPASDSKDMVAKLAEQGVNVFRLNMSHQSSEDALKVISRIKSARKTANKPIGILADLSGPKIRIGSVEPKTVLKPGDSIKITGKSVMGNDKKFSINFSSILKNIKPGTTIFIGDGDIIMKAKRRVKDGVTAEVVSGGELLSGKGFLPQDISLGRVMITKKDREDVERLHAAGVTAFAVSFVQGAGDIKKVRRLLPENSPVKIIAKIETPLGVKNAEEIIDEADGIMIARGDLGLAIPMEDVPETQKSLIDLALRKAKPIITATQMLESMRENTLPTRAEVTDVTTAVLDGTDAVMFSAETATGKHPLRVVEMTRAIIESAEPRITPRDFAKEDKVADAISASVTRISKQVGAKLIIVLTESGRTARIISRYRYNKPIIAVSPSEPTVHHLNLSWGVYPHHAKKAIIHNFDELLKETQKIAKTNRISSLKKGDVFVVAAGIPFEKSGTTNMVLVEKVE